MSQETLKDRLLKAKKQLLNAEKRNIKWRQQCHQMKHWLQVQNQSMIESEALLQEIKRCVNDKIPINVDKLEKRVAKRYHESASEARSQHTACAESQFLHRCYVEERYAPSVWNNETADAEAAKIAEGLVPIEGEDPEFRSTTENGETTVDSEC